METILQYYVHALAAYLIYSVFIILLDEKLPNYEDLIAIILMPSVIFAAAKYTKPGFSEALGEWSALVTILSTITVSLWCFSTVTSWFMPESEKSSRPRRQQEESQTYSSEYFPKTLDQIVGSDNEETISKKEKIYLLVGMFLFIPALILNYLS